MKWKEHSRQTDCVAQAKAKRSLDSSTAENGHPHLIKLSSERQNHFLRSHSKELAELGFELRAFSLQSLESLMDRQTGETAPRRTWSPRGAGCRRTGVRGRVTAPCFHPS